LLRNKSIFRNYYIQYFGKILSLTLLATFGACAAERGRLCGSRGRRAQAGGADDGKKAVVISQDPKLWVLKDNDYERLSQPRWPWSICGGFLDLFL
jgi:hypothetical protein